MKRFLSIAVISIITFIASAEQRDSISFEYSDFGSYSIASSGIHFANTDSASVLRISGADKRTIYDTQTKNDFGIEGSFAVLKDNLRFGCLLSTNNVSNSSSTRPTNNDIRIMPLSGYSGKNFDIEGAVGYVSKLDETERKEGQAVELKGNYSISNPLDRLNLSANFTADNTDDDLNFNTDSQIGYIRVFDGNFGNISAGGSGNMHQYSYSDTEENTFRIRRYEYNISSDFLYIASDKIQNISGLRFYSRNRDTYKNESSLSYNSNTDINLSNEIIYLDNRISSSLKAEFDTGSDKFSLDYDEADKSLSFYNFSLTNMNYLSLKDYRFGLSGKYFKHQYKSLTVSNLEDRDIVTINLMPEASYSGSKYISIVQTFPLEYHKLINISSQRSANNYTDRIVNSVTDLRSELSSDLYMTGKIHFRSYYRSFDFDQLNSKSFIIKNYSVSDTVSYKFTNKILLKLNTKFTYEEFGYLDYSAFTSNPVNFKNHYYSSLSFLIGRIRDFHLRTEYFFYEIDSYNFDQDDFSDHILQRVYISHGPKLGIDYTRERFHFSCGFELENYRSGDPLVRFSARSYVAFD